MKIYGAGIAGLLAGCIFQNARIYESLPAGSVQHKALLRFRSSAVGDAVGIDFRCVRVHKGIRFGEKFVEPTIQLANWYSQKVVGRIADRSIWNLEPVDRFIAPEDFIEQLAERCNGRIHWNYEVAGEEFLSDDEPAISTLPMSVVARWAAASQPSFVHAPIKVKRWRVPGADVFQTIYFPHPSHGLYRASITGNLLIAEYIESKPDFDNIDRDMFSAFGLGACDVEPLEGASQRFGKIAPIDDAWRKRFIFELTSKHNVYSLGRFGTWRNILLDDVIKDIAVLKKLMNSSIYERHKAHAK